MAYTHTYTYSYSLLSEESPHYLISPPGKIILHLHGKHCKHLAAVTKGNNHSNYCVPSQHMDVTAIS